MRGVSESLVQPLVQEAEPIRIAAAAPPLRQSSPVSMDLDVIYRYRNDDDDNMTETSRGDDDPVGDAFREGLKPIEGSEYDEEEDSIVWNIR